jgi:hypothetical protein
MYLRMLSMRRFSSLDGLHGTLHTGSGVVVVGVVAVVVDTVTEDAFEDGARRNAFTRGKK